MFSSPTPPLIPKVGTIVIANDKGRENNKQSSPPRMRNQLREHAQWYAISNCKWIPS